MSHHLNKRMLGIFFWLKVCGCATIHNVLVKIVTFVNKVVQTKRTKNGNCTSVKPFEFTHDFIDKTMMIFAFSLSGECDAILQFIDKIRNVSIV